MPTKSEASWLKRTSEFLIKSAATITALGVVVVFLDDVLEGAGWKPVWKAQYNTEMQKVQDDILHMNEEMNKLYDTRVVVRMMIFQIYDQIKAKGLTGEEAEDQWGTFCRSVSRMIENYDDAFEECKPFSDQRQKFIPRME